MELAEDMASKVTMELMFKQRSITRISEQMYNKRMALVTGVEYNANTDWKGEYICVYVYVYWDCVCIYVCVLGLYIYICVCVLGQP